LNINHWIDILFNFEYELLYHDLSDKLVMDDRMQLGVLELIEIIRHDLNRHSNPVQVPNCFYEVNLKNIHDPRHHVENYCWVSKHYLEYWWPSDENMELLNIHGWFLETKEVTW
jgi:hypothetical protein